MKDYLFAISEYSVILAFDSAFRKEIYSRYITENKLTKANAADAFTDWTAFGEDDSEKPEPLPLKYTGDIYSELHKIYIDLSCLGITLNEELDIVFEDCIGTSLSYYDCFAEDYVSISYRLICRLLTRMDCIIKEITEDGQKIFVVNQAFHTPA